MAAVVWEGVPLFRVTTRVNEFPLHSRHPSQKEIFNFNWIINKETEYIFLIYINELFNTNITLNSAEHLVDHSRLPPRTTTRCLP